MQKARRLTIIYPAALNGIIFRTASRNVILGLPIMPKRFMDESFM
jgi:hypothetical protein